MQHSLLNRKLNSTVELWSHMLLTLRQNEQLNEKSHCKASLYCVDQKLTAAVTKLSQRRLMRPIWTVWEFWFQLNCRTYATMPTHFNVLPSSCSFLFSGCVCLVWLSVVCVRVCLVLTDLTETENSPGADSLSLTRNTPASCPRKRFSASCRETSPAYHLHTHTHTQPCLICSPVRYSKIELLSCWLDMNKHSLVIVTVEQWLPTQKMQQSM